MPLDIGRIRSARPDTQIHYFPRIDTTMAFAASLVLDAPHGTVVVADEQTAGVGRLGRSWISQPDLGLYCSIILQLPLFPANMPIASLLLGLATAEAIEKSAPVACDLRWPNDVLIQERKVAGILTHLVDRQVVAGIGVNVNHTSFDSNLRTPATSIRMACNGAVQSRESLLIHLLDSIDSFCSMLKNQGADAILKAFTSASSYAVDRRVILEDRGIKGTTVGLDENGFLLVRLDSGSIERIATGGIRPAA